MTEVSTYGILKKLVPDQVKKIITNLKNKKYYRDYLYTLDNELDNNRFILMATPEHGNLGDHAIAIAQHRYLKYYFPNKKIYEITGDCYRACRKKIKKLIRPSDIIIVSGGGFLGSLWIEEEKLVRKIIIDYPVNPIIIFPQTIYFENNRFGKKQFSKSKSIYSRHNQILFAVRDRNSKELALQLIGKSIAQNVILIPDIVTYLSGYNFNITRKDILVCLRQDKEKLVNQQLEYLLDSISEDCSEDYRYTDTVINKRISTDMRDTYIKQKLIEFSSSKLVITDRLHGMLFAAITGTPCIAMNNLSGKIEGVYEWIKYLDYIKLVKDIKLIPGLVKILLNYDCVVYDNSKLIHLYDELANKLKNF